MKRYDKGLKLDAVLSTQAMAEYAGQLAARLSVNARARLRLRRATPRRLGRLGAEAARLAAQSAALPPAMQWLNENIRWVEEIARTALSRRMPKLPARDGAARLETLMRETVAHCDGLVSEERLVASLTAFDRTQGLSMGEIWLAPLAVKLALLEAFYTTARQVLQDQRARRAAEKWVDEGAPLARLPARPGSAFCERALKILHERETPGARRALEEWLEARAGGSEAIIRRAHERQALNHLVLSNVLSSLRALDALNWEQWFERISCAERTLREDAVYPLMDERSRSVLRDQVRLISRRSGLCEWTVARHAVRAAQGEKGAKGTCCWWLYDDQGRRRLMERLGAGKTRLASVTPDPAGRWLMGSCGVLAALIFWALWAGAGRWYLLGALALLAWRYAVALVNALVTRTARPRPLLKMEYECLPDDARTLVVMPALLTGPERARQLAEQLEALGALSTDKNVEYLLLGDFRDAPSAREAGDEAILEEARAQIEALNRRAGARKYHYLHRARHYAPRDGRFMGCERKRGALMALNQLLLGGESPFEEEDASADLLRGKFRYVLTLDADTRMLPGTTHALVGAARHPLNRPRVEDGRRKGYAVFSPRVELSAGSRFSRLLGGAGGVDSYPTLVSNACQDLCGRGIFGGKGLYDLEAFSSALEGRIPDGAVLSHDLLEGALAGAALVGDVAVHDGFPATLAGYLRRSHRWTRGDWQLLPFLFSGLPLDGLSRFFMADNMARSLSQGAALWVLLLSMWTGDAAGVLAALIEPFLGVITALPAPGGEEIRRAAARLALLPAEAVNQADAVARALYRMGVSRKNLLEWTPAADADRQGPGFEALPGRAAAILLVPTLFRPGWSAAALGLGALFAAGANWMRALQKEPPRARMTGAQVESLNDLARRTWRFFDEYVPLDSPGLPPDNVQIDPPVGAAKRTSPTNIGLYLTSCLAARELHLITPEHFEQRILRTLDTLEALDKWRGHLYNWYDLDSLTPLPPRYVSAVDSGNLAACLLMAGAAVPGALGRRMEALARSMDFTALYDRSRKLFRIGYDAANDRLSDAHYDLLASEARILSYTAIALGQAPVKHWFRLGRPRAGQALLSWSGTLFEYLMPEIFLRAPEGSLLWESNRAVVNLQRRAHPDGWGISESGFYAFDLQMNYQYRAFGLERLSLRGGSFEGVIAPYSSVLALPVDAQAALDNLEKMKESGWMGQYGLYEAVDLDPMRLPEGIKSRVVMSHMAHHQGMILASVANALTDDRLRRYFDRRPETRALAMLLEEKPAARPGRPIGRRAPEQPQRRPQQRATRAGRPDACLPDSHLLYGGGATCLVTAKGEGFLRMKGVMANRFREGLFAGEADGLYAHAKVDGKYARWKARARFGEGEAQWACRVGQVACRLAQSVSPEDGALNQQLFLHNQGALPAEIELTGCFAVALCGQAEMEAHPAFQNLFVSAEAPAEGVLVFRRRPRRRGDKTMVLVYKLSAPEGARHSFETDLARLAGRDGQLDDPAALSTEFHGEQGPAIQPCAALRARFSLAPGDACQAVFTCALCENERDAGAARARAGRDAAQRARLLALTQARAMLDFLSIDAATHHLLQRAAAFLFYPGLRGGDWRGGDDARPGYSGLWALGVSGDLPIIAVFVGGKEQLPLAREAARAHEFYRSMGVWCDLVLVNDYGNDYLQPVRDQLRQLIERGHLREIEGQAGGVRLVDGQSLAPAQRRLLEGSAALSFTGGTGSMAAQLRRMLNCPEAGRPARPAMAATRPNAWAEGMAFNGYGGFAPGGDRYQIALEPGRPTPAAWCNVLAGPKLGCLVSERGGLFVWARNSRMGRLTAWSGDALREGFPLRLDLSEPESGREAALLPVAPPAGVEHAQGYTRFRAGAAGLRWTLTLFAEPSGACLCARLALENTWDRPRRLTLSARCAFLMGGEARDLRMVQTRGEDGRIFARGAMAGVGYLCLEGAKYAGEALHLSLELAGGGRRAADLLLGWADTPGDAVRDMAAFGAAGGGQAALKRTTDFWLDRLSRVEMLLPDALMGAMVNRFLPYQALAGRVYGRAGLYQAGGAFGFRDQLQDMLCLIPIEPQMVRAHLLECAARQFEAGDVLHWWHEPAVGVRTHITDDLLFLPYVTACYVRETGDRSVLLEEAPYLREAELSPDKEDVYAAMEPGDVCEALAGHCLRAIRRAARVGARGLPRMGSGDWNDGMNQVKGESVWLGEFLSVVARLYADECAAPEQREELYGISQRMLAAVEESGWTGGWYRRAFFENGEPMGQTGCRIDVIAQGWAVLAGVERDRAQSAMDEAWRQLADQGLGIIRLLTPPFGQDGPDPGYIAAYPPGVRENGGQYTHGACWGVMGWARLGQADRAWRAFQMLMPYTHARSREAARRYRVEPYAAAADVYAEPPLAGRGGWTWYTGAAGWLCRVALTELMGYERRADRARLNALLPPEWPEASVRVRVGQSRYTLTARRGTLRPEMDGAALADGWIDLIDDQKEHHAVFPPRGAAR